MSDFDFDSYDETHVPDDVSDEPDIPREELESFCVIRKYMQNILGYVQGGFTS